MTTPATYPDTLAHLAAQADVCTDPIEARRLRQERAKLEAEYDWARLMADIERAAWARDDRVVRWTPR